MENISKACENLEEGDLIRIQYDEGNTEGQKTVIARYLNYDSQEEILRVGEIFSPIISRDQYSDPTIFSTHFAKFSEIRGLEKLVPETLT